MKNSISPERKMAIFVVVIGMGFYAYFCYIAGRILYDRLSISMGIIGAIMGYRQWQKERARKKASEDQVSKNEVADP